MAGMIYYNKAMKVIDRVLVTFTLIFVVVWVYTKASVSPYILLMLGLQRLLYAYNANKMELKRGVGISLGLGVLMVVTSCAMLVAAMR
ncbi:hypothetical protein [Alkaliphilus oremlandii]|uniref:Uncharacterized protein n=1 Tax=Alkaliphilus oremlandii (strain OhILAs) TaxID=350688 RepID=A8MFQ9_ALKOO|nr:hypothetical protein [Alkaliphilus oremlandii]ABW17698.1 hypothetical protein Clos_0131 [Alkaliphilus oremlandii OhILAs]